MASFQHEKKQSGKGTIVLAYAERIFKIKDTPTKCHFFACGLTMNDAIKRVIISMMDFRKKNPTFPSLEQIDKMDKQMDYNWADNILSKIN